MEESSSSACAACSGIDITGGQINGAVDSLTGILLAHRAVKLIQHSFNTLSGDGQLGTGITLIVSASYYSTLDGCTACIVEECRNIKSYALFKKLCTLYCNKLLV